MTETFHAGPNLGRLSDVTIIHGDCIEAMRELADDSIDAIVTDPPYGLEFMGKEWDAPWKDNGRWNDKPHGEDNRLPTDENGVSTGLSRWKTPRPSFAAGLPFQQWCAMWTAEALRVLKPGGHLLAFGGTRTWHRLAVAVEDAGFEIRDSIAWLYGSGFPKSLDVSKAIDKKRDDYPAIRNVVMFIREAVAASSVSRKHLDEALGGPAVMAHFLAPSRSNAGCPTWDQWQTLKLLLEFGDDMDAEVWRLNGRKGTPGEAWEMRPITQAEARPLVSGSTISFDQRSSTERERRDAPATPEAEQWQGWGTALKPAFEPVVVGRKPFKGNVAANVLEWGCGALNIDGCRIVSAEQWAGNDSASTSANGYGPDDADGWQGNWTKRSQSHTAGRWPANVVLDESQAAALDEQSGTLSYNPPATYRRDKADAVQDRSSFVIDREGGDVRPGYSDKGGASRFFYCAKAPKKERPVADDGTAHPTVKPLALMRWLVRLVTPPGGVVLDPFAGSGTTVEAALLEGFRVIGIERETDYLPMIQQRIVRTLR